MKKLLFALPVIVLLAASCQSQTNRPDVSTQTTNTETISPTKGNQYEGWQTYTSTAFNYSIQYPPQWKIDQTRSSANEVVFNTGSPESYVSIQVQSYTKTLNDWKKSFNPMAIIKTEPVTINNQEGVVIESGDIGGASGVAGVVYGGKLYIFNEVATMQQNGMLSTFKFTNISESLTEDQLKNTTYGDKSFTGSSFKLVNGILNLPYPKTDSQQDYFIKFNSAAFGGLNNDGVNDAAVIVDSRSGGSGDFVSLEVFVNKNGQPEYIDSKSLGDRTRIDSLKIENNVIIISITPWNGGAGTSKTLKYKVVNNKLVSQ